MEKAEESLKNHYAELDDFRRDFRNFNLATFVVSKVHRDSVLDIGCGSGLVLSLMQGQGKDISGLEPNEGLIEISKKLYGDLSIRHGNAEDIDKIGLKMDTIIMMDVLEHIKDDEAQLQKLHNALKKGGRIIIIVPASKILYGKRDIRHGHYRRYSRKELKDKIAGNGFDVVMLRYWNALAFLPYFFSEKVLNRELNSAMRTSKKRGVIGEIVWHAFNLWFKYVENRINFGFGLSLICIAEKKED